ncbi:MAG TPA: hypothetical protein VFQ66_09255, partial [Candidatus Limnocylindria bacterium]|nr:hypothetical protein [Candidatus Limnocylindria bacterium]
LARDVRAGRPEALSSFWPWLERVGTPLIEPVADGNAAVTFVWRHDGKARSVAVIQDWVLMAAASTVGYRTYLEAAIVERPPAV